MPGSVPLSSAIFWTARFQDCIRKEPPQPISKTDAYTSKLKKARSETHLAITTLGESAAHVLTIRPCFCDDDTAPDVLLKPGPDADSDTADDDTAEDEASHVSLHKVAAGR